MRNKIAAFGLVLALSGGAARAEQSVIIGYQTGVDPAKVAIADGSYEKAASGWKIDWRKFDTGPDVIAAVASGDVAIGYVGSSPLAAAASRELPIKTFFIASLIGESEALVARNGSGIAKPEDLKGKKVAVPFVSTTHYSLLAALKHWSVDPKTVEILNLRPPEIAAAWQRGDIDAAYVWDPALSKVKQTGTELTSSAEVAKWGSPTFDAWIVRNDFAAKNPAFVTSFARVTSNAYAAYRAHPEKWTASSPEALGISRLTGVKPEDVPQQLQGAQWPVASEQASAELLDGGTAKALAQTSAFLLEQKKIPSVLKDYSPYVTSQFAKASLASN